MNAYVRRDVRRELLSSTHDLRELLLPPTVVVNFAFLSSEHATVDRKQPGVVADRASIHGGSCLFKPLSQRNEKAVSLLLDRP